MAIVAAALGPRRGRAAGADALAARRGLHGLLRLQARLDEAVVQQLLGVEKRQRSGARAEDDHQKLLAATPGGDREVVAGLVREAGLERLHATGIAEQRNVARVDTTAVQERLATEE